MLRPTTILGILIPLVASSLVACSAPHRKDVLPVEDAPPGSTTRSAPSGSSVLTPTVSAPSDSDRSPEDADASADAATAASPSCNAKVMWSKAPATICSVANYTYSGGTLAVGEYYLSQWADGGSSCTCPNEHQGTMSIEQIGDQLYMRWTRSIGAESEAGMYLLAVLDATTMSRTEVCNEGTSLTEPTVMSYTATSSEIVFGHADGQERWTAIP